MKKTLIATGLALALNGLSLQAATLQETGHIHEIELLNGQLILGAHHGLFSYDGQNAELKSQPPFDVMGLTRSREGRLLASGHPPSGGNTGLLESTDGGMTFTLLSNGLDGPVDFHHLAVSQVNPDLIWGVHGTLQVSRDGGKNWESLGPAPQRLLKLAASQTEAERLYAATEAGLLMSDDGGKDWKMLINLPATTVAVHQGKVWAFVVSKGLIFADESELKWREAANAFGAQVLLDLAINDDGSLMFGLSQFGRLLRSEDGGRSWNPFPQRPEPATEAARRGQALFAQNCASCHGKEAVGETYTYEGLTTDGYLFAPALNGTMHGWHHTDEQLLKTILEGSPRTSRMPAWKGTLSEDDARDIIAYLKSLWSEAQRRCQGPGHMDRTCLQGN